MHAPSKAYSSDLNLGAFEPERRLPLPVVMHLTGLSRATIYRAMKNELGFPPPLPIGLRRKGWRAGDVLKWLEDRAASPNLKAA